MTQFVDFFIKIFMVLSLLLAVVPARAEAIKPWGIIPDLAKRFVALPDKQVLDRQTGLIWRNEPLEGNFTWDRADEFCTEEFDGGRTPSMEELVPVMKAIIAGGTSVPFVNVIGASEELYWTSSVHRSIRVPTPGANRRALAVRTSDGNPITVDLIDDDSFLITRRLLCVRGGSNHND